VRKLEAKHAAFASSLDTQIGGLRQLEENELQQTLKRRQQQFVASYMKRQTIDAAIIAGIGPAAKQALRKQGIVRAEDLEPGRLAQIEGIGEAKARVLLEWRRKAESLALQTAPQNLSKIEETLIRGRYFQRRFSLEQEKIKAQRRLAREITAAQAGSAARLKALDEEPANLRKRAAQQRDELRKRHQARRAEWQARLQVLDNQAAGNDGAIDQEAALVRQELALLNAQRASIELRLRRYESLAFGSYVRRVAGLS
jgi:tRNA A22 N-methylase